MDDRAWLGLARRAERPLPRDFFHNVLGCTIEFEESETTELSFAGGDRVQVFARDTPTPSSSVLSRSV
jgi:hypothetical protein